MCCIQLRKFVLSYLLNGNWRDEGELQHFCQYGCCPNFTATLKLLAVYGTWALCPKQPPVFPRSRWTRYDECVDYCGLLQACHGLLGKLIAEVSGKPVSAPKAAAHVPPAQQADGQPELDDWGKAYAAGPPAGVQEAEEDMGLSPMEAAQAVPVPPEENTEDGDFETEWKKQKRQNKKKAEVWVGSRPLRKLATWTASARVLFW